jgi:hypothetical protein
VATQTVCKDASATFAVPLTWSAAYDSVTLSASAGATCFVADSNLTCTVSAAGASVDVTAVYGGGAALRAGRDPRAPGRGVLNLQGPAADGALHSASLAHVLLSLTQWPLPLSARLINRSRQVRHGCHHCSAAHRL